MVNHRTLVITVLVVIILVASSTAAVVVMNNNNDSGEKKVVNNEMLVSGIEKDGVVTFKGIPYAEAPVGDLRFAPPVAKKQWTEVLDCTNFGNIPVQSQVIFDGVKPTPEHTSNESEDCLNLNIWAPADAKSGSKCPVYVWIYGGGYANGYGSNPSFDGTKFAQKGVIVVTFNYRVGMLGFLCLDSLRSDNSLGTSGTWGTLDQILALKWVHDNISKFGGDTNNVTVGGESAGSMSVFNMVMSPLTRGYFQKVIMESGSTSHCSPAQYSYEAGVEASKLLVSQFGVEDNAEGIKKLRSMSAYELNDASPFDACMTADHSTAIMPIYDGVVIPSDCLTAIENGEYDTNLKMLIGYNTYEGLLFTKSDPTEEEFDYLIKNAFDSAYWDDVKNYYDSRTTMTMFEKTAELTGCTMFKLGGDKVQKLFSRNGTVVYGFEFAHTMVTSDGIKLPYHSLEIEYGFGHDTVEGYELDSNDKAIRDAMHGYWVNFIKTGDPNGGNLTKWDRYNETEDKVMTFLKHDSLMYPKMEVLVFQNLSQWYFPDNP